MPSVARSHSWVRLSLVGESAGRFNAALLVCSLILLLRPYQGIWHDSILYLGQALAVLHPEPFGHDIFFAHGSQASYTLFPRGLAWLIERTDLGNTFLWLTLLGMASFLVGSLALVRMLLPAGARLPALLGLVLLPAYYGAWNILSYGEPFLTARTFAEPLVLVGIAAWLNERRLLAVAVLSVAVSLHPLQALPVVAAGWCWLLQGDRRWAHAAWLVPIAVAACLIFFPQSRTMAQLDPVWYSQVVLRNPITLYFTSGPSNWYNLLADAFILSVASRFCAERTRRCLLAVLGATALLATSQLMLVDGLKLAWFTALQPWRVHWLLHWFAMAMLPWACVQLWQQREEGGWTRPALFAASVMLGTLPSAAHPLAPGAILLYALWPSVTKRTGRTTQKFISGGVLCIACIHVVQQLQLPIRMAALLDYQTAPSEAGHWLIATMTLGLALPALAWRKLLPHVRVFCLLLTVAACVHAGTQWDQRSDLQRLFTQGQATKHSFAFAGLLRDSDQVLWIGAGPLPSWNLLHRAHYMDQVQMAGLVFNRATAIEGMRRKDRLHVTDGRGQDCRLVVYPFEPYSPCNPDETALRHACEQTLGELTHVVLSYPLSLAARGLWEPQDSTSRYYLYACDDLVVSHKNPTRSQ